MSHEWTFCQNLPHIVAGKQRALDTVWRNYVTVTMYIWFLQWLKYKFGGPGTLKKLGPLCKLKGPSQPARTINGCVWPGNARQQFSGAQERRFPAFPLTLTTGCITDRRIRKAIWSKRKIHVRFNKYWQIWVHIKIKCVMITLNTKTSAVD